MARQVIRRTFQPSVYSTGISFPSQGLVPRESYGDSDEYGFIFTALAAGKAIGAAKSAWGDEGPEEGSPAALAKKYWWAILLSLPIAYVAINRTLDFLGTHPGAR